MLTKISPTSQKNKSLLITIGFSLVLVALVVSIFVVSVVQVIRNGENRLTEIEVNRIDNILQEMANRTSRSLGDWSNWTETYNFAKDQNPDYIINNLMDETFITLDVHEILILNEAEEIIFQKFVDNENPAILESPVEASLLLNSYPEFADMEASEGLNGLAVINGQLMIVASNPILTSLFEGPPTGRIIFIKYLDQQTIQEISELALKKVELIALDGTEISKMPIPSYSTLMDGVFTLPEDANTINGYKYLKDSHGEPILIVKVENPRNLNLQGRTTMAIGSGILLFLVGLFSILGYLYIKAVFEANERKKEEENATRLLDESRQNAVELEKRVAERTRELEIRNKDLETFNYTVSHDLKSPLRGISGYATLLMTDHASQLDEEGKEYLQKLVDGAGQMNLLILDLLSYTKTERTESKKIKVDIERLLDQLLLDRKDELAAKNITILKKIDCKQVMVDRGGINLALRNLLDNAIKFTQTNENPEIQIYSKRIDGNCLISVSDNGIGFDMKYHDKIFAIFQRLHLPEEYPGTGIGLALVKKAMERLGGKVYAESEIGKGSTFHLEVPLN